MDTIKQIVQSNRYDVSIVDSINHNKPKQKQDHHNKKWTKFTYIGRETRQVTKLFRNTQVEVTYTTNNRTENLLHYNVTGETNKYEKSGVYQLSCPTCDKKYWPDRKAFSRTVPRTPTRLQVYV